MVKASSSQQRAASSCRSSSPPHASLSLASIPLKPCKRPTRFSFMKRTQTMDPPSSPSHSSSQGLDDPNATDHLSFSQSETSKSTESPSSLGEDDTSWVIKDTQGSMCTRQRLQQHRVQMRGKVIIPETWGREQQLQEWVNYGIVEDALRPPGLMSARKALVSECQHRGKKPVRTSPALSPDVEVS